MATIVTCVPIHDRRCLCSTWLYDCYCTESRCCEKFVVRLC